MKPQEDIQPKYTLVIGFLGEDHPTPPVHDGELWPDAQSVTNDEV